MLLYVSYKKKHLLKPAEFFIVNLAISDLGMTLSLYPLAVTSSLAHRYHKEIKTRKKTGKSKDSYGPACRWSCSVTATAGPCFQEIQDPYIFYIGLS